MTEHKLEDLQLCKGEGWAWLTENLESIAAIKKQKYTDPSHWEVTIRLDVEPYERILHLSEEIFGKIIKQFFGE